MRFPTLKHPRLCRVLVYLMILGAFLLPIWLVYVLSFVPDLLKMLVIVGLLVGLLWLLFREYIPLMVMDTSFAMLACYNAARTQYVLPPSFTLARVHRRISRFGTSYAPTALQPQPAELRYKLSYPWTVYTRGIEKVVAAYSVETLDAKAYRAIISSANANSKALIGTKKPLFLDRYQKKAPLNRVTVILIFAQHIDSQLAENLYAFVCSSCGDENEQAFLPCVVDLSRNICVFNSLRVPYIGYQYAVKNRGLRLIRRFLFGGQLPLAGNDFYIPDADGAGADVNLSLWAFWQWTRVEFKLTPSKTDKRMKKMSDRQILFQEDTLYVKWGEWAIALSAKPNPEAKTIELQEIRFWAYPKRRPITKKDITLLREHIDAYCAQYNWTATYQKKEKPNKKS